MSNLFFRKGPLPWTLIGIAVAGGATAGIMMGTRGPGDPNPNATTVSVTGSANQVP